MGSNKGSLLILIFLLSLSPLYSQSEKHIVYFKDKDNPSYSLSNPSAYLSQRAIERRQKQNIAVDIKDIPVRSDYLDSVSSTGAQIIFPSKWLNAVMVTADASQISLINNFSFVKSTGTATKLSAQVDLELAYPASYLLTTGDYGNSLSQIALMGGDIMHQDNYTGKGVLIAVIDAGFENADTLRVFDSLFLNNRVVATYDFVEMEDNVFDDHHHGTLVLSVMAGYQPGSLIGISWQASYLLLRSEDDASESLSEEFNFVRAAEYADSTGADIINCSLGYNTFDNPLHSHTYADMDGNTTIITRAADIAASKGILVVASAGNEGNKSWQKIICPADGDSVIAAGAVNALGYYASFSSKGPSSDGRIKPDLSGQGSGVVAAHPGGGMTLANGTSLSAPLISGLAAGIWQAYPELSNMDLFYYMRRSASKYYKPDNFTGYGIPNYRMVKMLIEDGVFEKASVFPNPGDGSYYVINLPLWENEKEVKLQIYDLRGRLVFSDHFTASLRIELNNVLTHSPAGLYFIRISGETREYVLKIIKE